MARILHNRAFLFPNNSIYCISHQANIVGRTIPFGVIDSASEEKFAQNNRAMTKGIDMVFSQST